MYSVKLLTMKKTLFLVIFILSFINTANAQIIYFIQKSRNDTIHWYNKSCGVADINNITTEEFDCLWDASSKTVRVGKITTGIGVASIGLTFLTGAKAFESGGFWNIPAFVFFGTSIVGIVIGPPIWITGAVRKSNLRKYPHYGNINSGSLKVSPDIGVNQFDNTFNYGLTLTLSF